MNTIYILYKLGYEECYIYGVFSSKDELEIALDKLGYLHIEQAEQEQKRLRDWYENVHIPFAVRSNREPNKPEELDMSLIELSKSLFGVYEIDLDKIIEVPDYLGY